MMSVVIFINQTPIMARSCRQVKNLGGNLCEYKVDDGTKIVHDRSDGAIELAVKMLKTIKE